MDKLGESITVKSEVGKWTCFTFTVKKYISNAIQLGPVDTSNTILYDSNRDASLSSYSSSPEESNQPMDAPYEVLSQADKEESKKGKGEKKNKRKLGSLNLL